MHGLAEPDETVAVIARRLGAVVGPWCACHALPLDRCPGTGPVAGRLPPAIPRVGETSAGFAALIDHTVLRPDATREQIAAACHEGIAYRFASVCVNPFWVSDVARHLASSDVGVCAVVGFPLGALPPAMKRHEAAGVLAAGATEVDMVMNIGALKSGDLRTAYDEIVAVVGEAADRGAQVKVILETALLETDEKIAGALLARAAGADYVKTSTGFGPGGATVADVRLLRRIVGDTMGVKASGGIRDLAQARTMLEAGATRLGTSAGVRIIAEWRSSQLEGDGDRLDDE